MSWTEEAYLLFLYWVWRERIYLQCKRPGISPWITKIPWRREWLRTLVFLSGDSMDRGARWTIVHGVAKRRTEQLTVTIIIMNRGSSFIPLLGIYFSTVQFSSVQSLSRVRLFATPWIAACQASLSITNSQSSLRLTSIESVMPSNHLILCRPFLLPPSVFPSIRVYFQWVNSSHEMAKVLQF